MRKNFVPLTPRQINMRTADLQSLLVSARKSQLKHPRGLNLAGHLHQEAIWALRLLPALRRPRYRLVLRRALVCPADRCERSAQFWLTWVETYRKATGRSQANVQLDVSHASDEAGRSFDASSRDGWQKREYGRRSDFIAVVPSAGHLPRALPERSLRDAGARNTSPPPRGFLRGGEEYSSRLYRSPTVTRAVVAAPDRRHPCVAIEGLR